MILPPRAAQPGHAFGGVHSMSVAPQRRNRHERRRSGEIGAAAGRRSEQWKRCAHGDARWSCCCAVLSGILPRSGPSAQMSVSRERSVIGVSAVGSLRAEIHPGELALPSQYLDFTRGTRAASFFGGGLVAHISSAQPACRATATLIARVAHAGGVALHEDKTYACVEGPRLGTRAESLFLRAAGADVVGMTNVPE